MSCNFFGFRPCCENQYYTPSNRCLREIPGPVGPRGPMGPAGPMGAQGATGATGATGTSAGFGTPTATATALGAGATPTVTVTANGPNTAKVFSFAFGIPAATTTFDALYASGTNETVSTNAIIPITQNTATDSTTLSVSANAVTVADAGVYLVTYGATGTLNSTTAGDFSVQLYANGTAIDGEVITDYGATTTAANVSKTILYTASAGDTLSIYNVSADEITAIGANLTVMKLF